MIDPHLVGHRFLRFTAVDESIGDWSMAGVAFTAILTSMLEVDPDWNPECLEYLRQMAHTQIVQDTDDSVRTRPDDRKVGHRLPARVGIVVDG